jgi:hypothetical protein
VKIIHTTPNPRLDVEYNATPPLDPIKAIVEILDIMIDVAAFDDKRGLLYGKLSALKRSLESGNETK